MPSPAQSRPTIGLALGGGGARGIAHIGSLAGSRSIAFRLTTLRGRASARWSPRPTRAVSARTRCKPWSSRPTGILMLLADSPLRLQDLRQRRMPAPFPANWTSDSRVASVPSAINSGQQVELLLDRIALPYFALDSFDALPTPFRCVATDIRKAESIVLGSGSLSDAVRASMAIPGVFRPVVLDGRLLVDGGALQQRSSRCREGDGGRRGHRRQRELEYRRAVASDNTVQRPRPDHRRHDDEPHYGRR